MDSLNCLGNQSHSAIKDLLESGALSQEEMYNKLKAAIDSEVAKPLSEIDEDYLIACQDLLNGIMGYKEKGLSQAYYEKRMIQYLEHRTHMEAAIKQVAKPLIAAMAMICVLIFGNHVLYREWLNGDSSDNQEQYEIYGKKVDPGFIITGEAADDVQRSEVITDDLTEISKLIGYKPMLPTWLPHGWKHHSFYAACNLNSWWFYEIYTFNEPGEPQDFLMYEVRWYDDVEDAEVIFEQNGNGNTELVDGIEVYLTINTDSSVAIWLDSNFCYSLHGPISQQEIKNMIVSISKED